LHSTLHFTRCLRIFLFGEKRRRVAAVLTIDYWGLDAILVQHPYPHHWFNSEGGHYEYLIMRYGLTYASAVFQSFFNEIFKDLLNLCVIVYIEDILIYSKDYSTHVSHVCLVLNQLLEHHLFVKAENCEFHQKIIIFFGYIISNMEVEMDTSKVSAVTEWPTPLVRNYRVFLVLPTSTGIQNYSTIAAPITTLLRGIPKKLKWNEAAQMAFQKLKLCFTTASIL
ncbi:hypothetical protein QTP86_033680, partial [Hemibagrus guttatus]